MRASLSLSVGQMNAFTYIFAILRKWLHWSSVTRFPQSCWWLPKRWIVGTPKTTCRSPTITSSFSSRYRLRRHLPRRQRSAPVFIITTTIIIITRPPPTINETVVMKEQAVAQYVPVLVLCPPRRMRVARNGRVTTVIKIFTPMFRSYQWLVIFFKLRLAIIL